MRWYLVVAIVVWVIALLTGAGAALDPLFGDGRSIVDPDNVGAAGVTTVDVTLVDTTRSTPAIGAFAGAAERALPTTVYLPAQPAGRGPADPAAAPLVVLAHGFDGHPRKFTDLATFWAAAGYVVAVPRFPVTNDEFIALADGPFFTERLADLGDQAVDVSFVIDSVFTLNDRPDDVLAGRIDPDHIGLYGLSLGALTVWTATMGGGATENRVDALIQSDGAFPGDTALLLGVGFPVFVTGSDVDQIFPPDVVLPQFAALPEPKFLLVLHGARHAAVGENTPTPADEAYRVATTVFWNRYLAGRPDEPFPGSIVIDGVTSFIDES